MKGSKAWQQTTKKLKATGKCKDICFCLWSGRSGVQSPLGVLLYLRLTMNLSIFFWAKLDFLAFAAIYQWLFVNWAENATLLVHLETAAGSKLKRRTTRDTRNLWKRQEAGKTRNVLVSLLCHSVVSKLSCIIRKLLKGTTNSLKNGSEWRTKKSSAWSIKGFHALLELQ